jgi:hypothetical protein
MNREVGEEGGGEGGEIGGGEVGEGNGADGECVLLKDKICFDEIQVPAVHRNFSVGQLVDNSTKAIKNAAGYGYSGTDNDILDPPDWLSRTTRPFRFWKSCSPSPSFLFFVTREMQSLAHKHPESEKEDQEQRL